MRTPYLLALVLFVATSFPVAAQEWVTLRDTMLYPSTSARLTTSAKDTLSSSVTEKPGKGSVELKSDTLVKVLKRSRFMQRETVYIRETSSSETVNRLFKVALVEVLNGKREGKQGWVVVSYRDTGGDPQVYLAQAPPKTE